MFADWLTIILIVSAFALIIQRAAYSNSRALCRFQDFFLLILLTTPFLTGFLALHPNLNPINCKASMLVHILSADLIFILIPFTKLSHIILYPSTQLISEIGWHFPADSGRKVAIALGKENQPI